MGQVTISLPLGNGLSGSDRISQWQVICGLTHRWRETERLHDEPEALLLVVEW